MRRTSITQRCSGGLQAGALGVYPPHKQMRRPEGRRYRALLVMALVGLMLPTLRAQAPAPARAKLADFAWMAGEWRGELKGAPPGRYAEETVAPAAGGAVMGMFRLVEGEKTLVLEFFTMRESPEGFELRFRHFDTALTAWEKGDPLIMRLVSFDGTRAVFENPVHSRPKTTEIIRTGKDSWRVRSEIIPESGEKNVIEIDWKRVK